MNRQNDLAVNFLLPSMHAREKINHIAALFEKKGIHGGEKEAVLIIGHATGIDTLSLFRDNPSLTEVDGERISALVQRRLNREPIEYIIGSVEFYGLTIWVGKGVLIPRPETEELVEEVLLEGQRMVASGIRPDVIDLCTGSGCIALSIASRMRSSRVYALDSSPEALRYARENAHRNGIDTVTFIEGDLFGPVFKQRYHLIVSNPPYIRTADIDTLQDEIRRWEPRKALDGGTDGLGYYREIIGNLDNHLIDQGKCFLEIGFDQRDAIEAMAHEAGFIIRFKKDLAGHYRIAVLSF